MTAEWQNLLVCILAAVIPPVLLGWYFRARDINPEPRRVTWITFLLGMLSVVPVLIIGGPIFLWLRGEQDPLASGFLLAFFAAAIPEEFFKLVVVVGYSARHKEFDEPMDGMVYGAAASLGFATAENLLYTWQHGFYIAVFRAFTAIPMHGLLGALMGYYVGRWRFGPGSRKLALIAAYVVPTALHGLYDFPVLTLKAMASGGSELTGSQYAWLLAPLAVLVLLVVWVVQLNRRLRVSQRTRTEPTPLS